LAPPDSARAATKDYLDTEDLLGQWLGERCTVSPKVGWTALKSLYDNYRSWAEPRGLHPGASQTLGKRLDERSFTRHRTNQGPGFYGIELLPTSDESDDCDDFPLIGRNDPLGARATDYARYGADRHNRHSGHADDPNETFDDRIRGEL
jgi:phage/plasmid-associated DNA primase